jgi:hypothetical protein
MNRSEKLRLRFWQKVRDYATKRASDAYLDACGGSRRCPYCGSWTHETDGPKSISSEEDSIREYMVCNRCLRMSLWENHGIFQRTLPLDEKCIEATHLLSKINHEINEDK